MISYKSIYDDIPKVSNVRNTQMALELIEFNSLIFSQFGCISLLARCLFHGLSLQVDVEARYVGWLSCQFSRPHIRVIQLEMKGPDHSLRVRQIKILGEMEGQEICVPVKKSAVDMQQENCESETLRVFRMLTSQVSFADHPVSITFLVPG